MPGLLCQTLYVRKGHDRKGYDRKGHDRKKTCSLVEWSELPELSARLIYRTGMTAASAMD